MRRLFNPITLFVTVTTVALVSTAASAKGPAASPKGRNAALTHQPAEKPSTDQPAVSNGSLRRGGTITVVVSRSSNGGGNARVNITGSGNGVGNRSINGLGGPQGGARNTESGTGSSTVPFPHHLNGTDGSTGGTTTVPFPHHLPIGSVLGNNQGNPPSGPPKSGIPPVYHPPGSGNPSHHPAPPTGTGTTTVTYFSGSVPVAAPTTDSSAATTANLQANDQAASLTNVPAGSTIKLDGSDFGAQPGRVTIVAGNMILPTDVVSWTEKSVSLTLPQIEMPAPVQAKFVVHRANGSAAMETPFQLSGRAK